MEKDLKAPVEVYSFYGIAPDDLGYLGAMYSRSNETILKKVESVTQPGKSEGFYDKFYHNYGHRSIGDMSMPNFAIEGLTEFDALWVYGGNAHRSRWQGQQRSTRYQDFEVTGYAKPSDWGEIFANFDGLWTYCMENYLLAYRTVHQKVKAWYLDYVSKPENMDPKTFERKVNARAFDIARFFLPLAMRTSLFQITSARTLEDQITELLTCEYLTPRLIGERLLEACQQPMVHVERQRILNLLKTVGYEEAARLIEFREPIPSPSPTLTRYTAPNRFRQYIRSLASEWAYDLFPDHATLISNGIFPNEAEETTSRVKLVDVEKFDPVVVTAAKFIFPYASVPFDICLVTLASKFGKHDLKRFLDQIMEKRGPHDEMPAEFRSYPLNFEIVMDIGSWRDLRRHRRCDQYHQELTMLLGTVSPLPQEDAEQGLTIDESHLSWFKKVFPHYQEFFAKSRYFLAPLLLSMATKVRTLFCMDEAQAHYMIELRSKPAGHFAYREVVYKMYQELVRKYPAFSDWTRVAWPPKPLDWLVR